MTTPAAPTPGPGPIHLALNKSPTPAKKATSNTCVTCRARKVKCDGRRDVCTNCERLGFTCAYGTELDLAAGMGIDLSPGTDGGLSTFSLPRRRVRQACQNCHARKARCSGAMPRCDRCRVQGIECVYKPSKRARLNSTSTSTATAAAGAGAGAGAGAANSARTAASSPGDHPGSAPADVLDFGRAAHRTPAGADISSPDHHGGRTTRHTSPGTTFGGPNDLPTPGPHEGHESLALRTFDNFFRHVHHVPTFSFLHRASLMQRYHAGLVDRILLLALIGITSLLTDLGPGMREYGDRCIDESESLILRAMERPSTLKLQALVLVIKHRIHSRRFSAAFMLTATASRFATALRLNHENAHLCFLAQESRRRLMWSLYMIDTGVAGGYADFTLWPADAIRIQLPCNERNFEYDLPEKTEPLEPPAGAAGAAAPPLPDDTGFLALHIRIHWCRSRIQQCTKRAVAGPLRDADLAALPARLAGLAAELHRFEQRLPLPFRWSDANVRLRAYSPRLCVYVMTHVWWRQCHVDLYRVGLAGLRDALPRADVGRLEALHPGFAAFCQRRCHEHARAMADMFASLLSLDNGGGVVPVMDLDLSVCAYQCARTLYYALRTCGDAFGLTGDDVAEMATVCLRVARRSTSTPATERMCADLENLIEHGLSTRSTPSGAATPEEHARQRSGSTPAQAGDDPADALLPPAVVSRHGLVDDTVVPGARDGPVELAAAAAAAAAAVTSTGNAPPAPMTPVGANVGAAGAARMEYELEGDGENRDEDSNANENEGGGGGGGGSGSTYALDPALARVNLGHHCGASTGTNAVSSPSNAFEGALDGLDFSLEPFGLDSLTWFPNEWLNATFPQTEA